MSEEPRTADPVKGAGGKMLVSKLSVPENFNKMRHNRFWLVHTVGPDWTAEDILRDPSTKDKLTEENAVEMLSKSYTVAITAFLKAKGDFLKNQNKEESKLFEVNEYEQIGFANRQKTTMDIPDEKSSS